MPKKLRSHKLYLGGSEWSICEVPLVEKRRAGNRKVVPGYTLCGLADYPSKRIWIKKGLGSERFEVMFHEGLHAVCAEGCFNGTVAALRDDEEAVTFLAKGMVSYLRQTRDWGSK